MSAINTSEHPTPPNMHTASKRAVATNGDPPGADDTPPVQQRPQDLFEDLASDEESLDSSPVALYPRPLLPHYRQSLRLNSSCDETNQRCARPPDLQSRIGFMTRSRRDRASSPRDSRWDENISHPRQPRFYSRSWVKIRSIRRNYIRTVRISMYVP